MYSEVGDVDRDCPMVKTYPTPFWYFFNSQERITHARQGREEEERVTHIPGTWQCIGRTF